MPRLTLTTRGIDALRPTVRPVDYWSDDAAERGFGVRVWPGGTKAWFQYTRKTKDGKAVRVTLGAFPKMKLAKAREEAQTARAKVQVGTNPADEHRAERQTRRETVQGMFDAYCEAVAVRQQAGEFRRWAEIRRSLERDVLPTWGERPARGIRRKDVIELVTRKALVGRTAANRLQAHVSMLLSFGVDHDWLDSNPAYRLRKRHEEARTRVLDPAEVRTLWTYLDGDAELTLARGAKETRIITMPPESAAAIRDVFKMLLLCGQRLGETSRMAWADVDLGARRWTIPGSQTKNRRTHTVPLSKPAIELLTRRAHAGTSAAVFPSRAGSDASIFVWTKRSGSAISAATGVKFTAHDCRRTVATMLGELGVSGDVIGLVLNHSKPGVTGKHYDHSKREADKCAALDRWAQRLEKIITQAPATVTQMRGKA